MFHVKEGEQRASFGMKGAKRIFPKRRAGSFWQYLNTKKHNPSVVNLDYLHNHETNQNQEIAIKWTKYRKQNEETWTTGKLISETEADFRSHNLDFLDETSHAEGIPILD